MLKNIFLNVIFLFCLLCVDLFSIEITVIKNPQPTCMETELSSLEITKVISTINEKVFLAQPVAITGDDNGNIYIYDNLHCKIFKFDKNSELVNSFGRLGHGPGTFRASGDMATIYCGKDKILYICDFIQKKIMSFTTDGKYLRDYKINPWRILQPVVDAKGNFYLPSASNGMIDVEDNNMNLKTTLLSENEYRNCLFIKPTFYFSRTEIFSNYFNTDIGLLSDSSILIYNRNTSTIYLLDKNFKLVRKANLWPKNALEDYGKRLQKFQKDEDFGNAWIIFFHSLFIDEDKKNIFYLQTKTDMYGVLIYAFDLKGRLMKVLKIDDDPYVRIKWKKNNLFYGFGSKNDLRIYKEKEERR
jgi:hypothetical protein